MKTRAYVKGRKISFGSLVAQERFYDRAEGKYIFLTLDDSPTAEMRRYFEGCIVPVTFYAHPRSGWRDFAEAREAIKFEFLPHKRVTPVGGYGFFEAATSTTELSKEEFKNFLEAVIRWLLENELVTELDIDAEAYKQWRDSAPSPDEIYPLERGREERRGPSRTSLEARAYEIAALGNAAAQAAQLEGRLRMEAVPNRHAQIPHTRGGLQEGSRGTTHHHRAEVGV
jgi:hypothetical protein